MTRYFTSYDSPDPCWRLDDDESLWCLCDGSRWVKQADVRGGNVAFIELMLQRDRFIETGPAAPYTIQTCTEDAW